MEAYDVVVVGTGTAGQTAAHDLNAGGLAVAVAECSERPGGTCALSGCQPKKFYYEIMETIARARHQMGRGIASIPRASWPQTRAAKDRFTGPVPERTVEGFKKAGIDYLTGDARFMDAVTLAVGERRIRADFYLLATGAEPMALPFEGSEHLLTNVEFMDLENLPQRIVFVGGGFISFEFAHFAARLGPADSRLQIIEVMDRPLGPFDADMVRLLVNAGRDEGISVAVETEISAVSREGDFFRVNTASGQTFEADLVVHGAGRAPRIRGLGLENAGIEYDRRGIRVDAGMRTTQARVFAAGDCAASVQLARVADYEAHVAAENILAERKGGEPSRIDYRAVPFMLFTYPQYGMIGKTEEALQQEGREYRKSSAEELRWPTYRRVGMKHGAYKILVGADDRILGAHILSDSAGGLINTIKHAMLGNLTIEALYRQSIMSPYPSRESDLLYMLQPLLSG
jgi:glutathione reductase (NADPH)